MGAGALEAERRQRVDLAVDRGDALFQHVEQIERSDVARIEFVDDRARRFAYQFLTSHFPFLPVPFLLGLPSPVDHFPAEWK